MPLPNGARVGRIRIDDLLGSGGMGEVYRGWDERLERPVALKSIHSEKRLSPALRSRFLREARVLSKLDHPNICRIWDVVETPDGDWLVLELIDGMTLRDAAERGLTRAEALRVTTEIARVLLLAHGRGIIHRDLKPENVMITPQGVVKVLDFGLARAIDSAYADGDSAIAAVPADLDKTVPIEEKTTAPDDGDQTSIGSLVGTLHYMSPEQARGLPLTPASDIYSLGIMLHEMLTGASAYGDIDSSHELLARVRVARIERTRLGDRALERLLARMTALHPGDRAPIGDVIAQLERIAERPAEIRRRVRMAAVAAALIVTVSAGAFAVQRMLDHATVAHRGARIAVLPFRNATGDRSMQWAEVGLMDHLARGLAADRALHVVDSASVTQAARKRSDPKQLLDALDADVLVSATITRDAGRYAVRYVVSDRTSSDVARQTSAAAATDAAEQVVEALLDRIDPSHAHSSFVSRDSFAQAAFDMGRRARLTRSYAVAANYYAVAVDRDSQFLRAKEELADVDALLGRTDDSLRLFGEVIADARRRREPLELARALVDVAGAERELGRYPDAERHAREALDLARRERDDREYAAAENELALVLWRRHDFDGAERLLRDALRYVLRLREPHSEAEIMNNMAVLMQERQRADDARHWYEQALRRADAGGNTDLLPVIFSNLSAIYAASGDLPRAIAMGKRSLDVAREHADPNTEATALASIGFWLYASGREPEAIASVEQARDIAARIRAKSLQAILCSALTEAQTRRGDLAAAQENSKTAQAIEAEIHDLNTSADVCATAAYVATRSGRTGDAARLLDQAERIDRSAHVAIFRARLAYARGEYARAATLIEQAKAMPGVWLNQYEQMRTAFAESARSGKPSTISFEEPVQRAAR